MCQKKVKNSSAVPKKVICATKYFVLAMFLTVKTMTDKTENTQNANTN